MTDKKFQECCKKIWPDIFKEVFTDVDDVIRCEDTIHHMDMNKMKAVWDYQQERIENIVMLAKQYLNSPTSKCARTMLQNMIRFERGE